MNTILLTSNHSCNSPLDFKSQFGFTGTVMEVISPYADKIGPDDMDYLTHVLKETLENFMQAKAKGIQTPIKTTPQSTAQFTARPEDICTTEVSSKILEEKERLMAPPQLVPSSVSTVGIPKRKCDKTIDEFFGRKEPKKEDKKKANKKASTKNKSVEKVAKEKAPKKKNKSESPPLSPAVHRIKPEIPRELKTIECVKAMRKALEEATPPPSPFLPTSERRQEYPQNREVGPEQPWQAGFAVRKKPVYRKPCYAQVERDEIDFTDKRWRYYTLEVIKHPIYRGKEATTWDDMLKYIRTHRRAWITGGYFKFVPILPPEEEEARRILLSKKEEELTSEELANKKEAEKTAAAVEKVHRDYQSYRESIYHSNDIPNFPSSFNIRGLRMDEQVPYFHNDVPEVVQDIFTRVIKLGARTAIKEKPIDVSLGDLAKSIVSGFSAESIDFDVEEIYEAIRFKCTSFREIIGAVLELFIKKYN